jgi:hypothetical protein
MSIQKYKPLMREGDQVDLKATVRSVNWNPKSDEGCTLKVSLGDEHISFALSKESAVSLGLIKRIRSAMAQCPYCHASSSRMDNCAVCAGRGKLIVELIDET